MFASESEVFLPVGDLTDKEANYVFPAPYYRLRNDSAYILLGNYAEELVWYEKQRSTEIQRLLR